MDITDNPPRQPLPNEQIIDCAGYENGRRADDLDINHIQEWIHAGSDRFVWLGLYEPDIELLRKIQRQFGLHDLAVEDALNAHQRPKLDFYSDSLFLVMHTAQRQDDSLVFGETHIFAGREYVVAVRHGASASYREVRARCEHMPDMLSKGSDFVLYSLMDYIVDNYLPVIEELETEAELIEENVLNSQIDSDLIKRVYNLKRHLMKARSMVVPVVEICSRLVRHDSTLIDEDMRPYFRDIHDHAIRIENSIGNLLETLSSTLEANLMLASVRQNDVMKKMAGYAALLAVPTAIAGIYGMNFDEIPELHWHYGYAFALTLMGSISGYLYYLFKKSGWL
jgi:magnesium transporter